MSEVRTQRVARFSERGSDRYGGEAVTQSLRALHSVCVALQENAPEVLIAATLSHNIWHLAMEVGVCT